MEKQDHEYCLRCGRRLKNIQARELGYGPVCMRKQRSSGTKPLFAGAVHLQSSKKEELA